VPKIEHASAGARVVKVAFLRTFCEVVPWRRHGVTACYSVPQRLEMRIGEEGGKCGYGRGPPESYGAAGVALNINVARLPTRAELLREESVERGAGGAGEVGWGARRLRPAAMNAACSSILEEQCEQNFCK
jgi:hypothetical protein